jgi:hypothetical protein
MRRHLVEGARPRAPNWGLLLMVVLCVEFWIVVTSAVAQHL